MLLFQLQVKREIHTCKFFWETCDKLMQHLLTDSRIQVASKLTYNNPGLIAAIHGMAVVVVHEVTGGYQGNRLAEW